MNEEILNYCNKTTTQKPKNTNTVLSKYLYFFFLSFVTIRLLQKKGYSSFFPTPAIKCSIKEKYLVEKPFCFFTLSHQLTLYDVFDIELNARSNYKMNFKFLKLEIAFLPNSIDMIIHLSDVKNNHVYDVFENQIQFFS
jgi:hypothetical protein